MMTDGKNHPDFLRLHLLRTCLLTLVCLASPKLQADEASPAAMQASVMQTFSDVRTALLNHIAAATSRVWVTTEYLTDGEICAALYLAQYRKIDVKVLLGRKYAHQYMSRLGYLKEQNIPVFLKPTSFSDSAATTLLVDQRLIRLNSDLNFLGKTATQAPSVITDPSAIAAFVTSFAKAAEQKLQATPRPVPLVGRKNTASPPSHKKPAARSSNSAAATTVSGSDAAYNYDRAKARHRQAPAGISQRLPKQTIQQQNNKDATVLPAHTPQAVQSDIDKME